MSHEAGKVFECWVMPVHIYPLLYGPSVFLLFITNIKPLPRNLPEHIAVNAGVDINRVAESSLGNSAIDQPIKLPFNGCKIVRTTCDSAPT